MNFLLNLLIWLVSINIATRIATWLGRKICPVECPECGGRNERYAARCWRCWKPLWETRKGHLLRCRERALFYLDSGNYPVALASLLSDLAKHSETAIDRERAVTLWVGAYLDTPEKLRGYLDSGEYGLEDWERSNDRPLSQGLRKGL